MAITALPARTCSVDGCGRAYAARGFCSGHYSRLMKGGDVNPTVPLGMGRPQVVNGCKRCTQCSVVLPLDEFHRNCLSPSGFHPWCKKCRSAIAKRRYSENPDIYAAKQRWNQVWHRYRMTQAQYQSLLLAQEMSCAICHRKPTEEDRGSRLSIDHDHACCPQEVGRLCGKCNRALLCMRCNSLLGLAGEDEKRLTQAVSYLRTWS